MQVVMTLDLNTPSRPLIRAVAARQSLTAMTSVLDKMIFQCEDTGAIPSQSRPTEGVRPNMIATTTRPHSGRLVEVELRAIQRYRLH